MREKTPAIAHFLPSLTDIAFLMPLIFLFVKLNGARTLLGDGDTGWHVRTGEWILAHGQVPRTDFFSFSRPGAPWFAWEWLWDVLFALLHQRWGTGRRRSGQPRCDLLLRTRRCSGWSGASATTV